MTHHVVAGVLLALELQLVKLKHRQQLHGANAKAGQVVGLRRQDSMSCQNLCLWNEVRALPGGEMLAEVVHEPKSAR